VVNVARFDVFKLSEAALSGQPRRVQRMLDGLRAEGEAEVLVHFNLSDEVRQLRRVKLATESGRPLAMALRESGVRWGKEQLYEQAIPRLGLKQLDALMAVAQATDGIVKGLKQPGLPSDPWAALSHLGTALAKACVPSRA
jgi:DNA polymerase III subunit delta